MNKLRNRLIMLVLGGALLSIVLVSILTNITLSNRFNDYMEEEQQERVRDVISLIKSAYRIEERWTNKAIDNIKFSPLIKDYDVVIKDNAQNILLVHDMRQDMMEMHRTMMDRMGRVRDKEDYVVKNHLLNVDGQTVGTVEIGYTGPFIVSESDIAFTKGINQSILLAAMISIIMAIIAGVYFSKYFSNPIINITEAANRIRMGDLETKVETTNNIKELKALSNAINHLSYSLNEQQVLRKRLTSDISHELRTPLTVLQSHIEAMIDGIWEPTTERLHIFKHEVSRLIKLVEQLRGLTDIESHEITLEIKKFDISATLYQIVESFRYQFEDKAITLLNQVDKQQPIEITGDEDKISQIIINLLANAYKFSLSGGQVTVELYPSKEYVTVVIEDTGIGIPKEDLPYIFERFYRSEKSRNRKTGGAGLGLTITKTLVETHKGTIKVESEVEKGTKFTITLPVKTSEEA